MSLEPNAIRIDLLGSDLTEDQRKVKVIAEEVFGGFIERAVVERTRTPGNTKDIFEVLDLIQIAIKDYESRNHSAKDAQIDVIYEKPDKPIEVETISLAVVSRVPGMYAQGKPGDTGVKNRRPILREMIDDPDNPGYKRAVLGFFYDNVLRLTCWAKTNKAANDRAIWLENLMEEYDWFFVWSGVNRLLYESWRTSEVIDIVNSRYYGRPIDFFVRTEKLINVSEKTLEQICIKFGVKTT